MKQNLIAAARIIALGGTAWLLIATSQPPRTCTVDGPVTYTIVKNTCGATGEVQISNDATCGVQLNDGSAFGLPKAGLVLGDESTFRASGATLFRDFGSDQDDPADAGSDLDAGGPDAGANEEADAGAQGEGADADAGLSDAGAATDAGTTPSYDTCTLSPSATDPKTLVVTCTSAGVTTCEAELTEK